MGHPKFGVSCASNLNLRRAIRITDRTRQRRNLIELFAETIDTESMSEDKPKRFPIPHPGVLLAVALVLVVIAVGLSVWIPYHRQQVAIRKIERLRGQVYTVLGKAACSCQSIQGRC